MSGCHEVTVWGNGTGLAGSAPGGTEPLLQHYEERVPCGWAPRRSCYSSFRARPRIGLLHQNPGRSSKILIVADPTERHVAALVAVEVVAVTAWSSAIRLGQVGVADEAALRHPSPASHGNGPLCDGQPWVTETSCCRDEQLTGHLAPPAASIVGTAIRTPKTRDASSASVRATVRFCLEPRT